MRGVRLVSSVSATILAMLLLFVSAAADTYTVVPRPLAPSPAQFSSAARDLGNSDRGKVVFEKRCSGCHAPDENREGPLLRGLFGRRSGEIANFEYSAALKKAHLVWNEETLERWLTDPDVLVPDNNMGFRVAKPQERQDLIRYLRDGLGK